MKARKRRNHPRVTKATKEIVAYVERNTGLTGELVEVRKHPVYRFGHIEVSIASTPRCPFTLKKTLAMVRRKLREA